MRWSNLLAGESDTQGLFGTEAVMRNFSTPEFQGMTFYEIHAKSILNRVGKASRMSFRWTINPYRGCGHKCRYCFARPTHEYLGLNSGDDFDSKVVVKVNASKLLRKELARKTWTGESIAMGTNVDPYQRAEGKYQLMRGILPALIQYRNPFSILTKGTLILRDMELLRAAAALVKVRVAVSVGFVDLEMWRHVEAGAPSPHARLRVCRTLTEAGVGCNVLMAPILPFLTDSDEQLEATVTAIAASGARSVTPLVLHLRPGVRKWFMTWLEQHRPELVASYLRLYRQDAYAPREYTTAVSHRVNQISQACGIEGARRPHPVRRSPEVTTATQDAVATQLSLL